MVSMQLHLVDKMLIV